MYCLLSGSNVKVLARTIQFLSKIGSELHFEVSNTDLILRAISPSKTSYITILFPSTFFLEIKSNQNDPNNICKISMKPVLKIFSSINKIKTCKIWIKPDTSKLIFLYKCKSDIVKTHIISLLDCEVIQQVRLPEEFPNKVVSTAKMFQQLSKYFHSSIDEINLDIDKEKITVTNYIENPSTNTSEMRSKCVLKSEAFLEFTVSNEEVLTFGYKELKAIITYAEKCGFDIDMNYTKPGAPLLIKLPNKDGIVVSILIGTMQLNRSLRGRNRSADRVASQINLSGVSMRSEISESDFAVSRRHQPPINRTNPHAKKRKTVNNNTVARVRPDDHIFRETQGNASQNIIVPSPSVVEKRPSQTRRTDIFEGFEVNLALIPPSAPHTPHQMPPPRDVTSRTNNFDDVDFVGSSESFHAPPNVSNKMSSLISAQKPNRGLFSMSSNSLTRDTPLEVIQKREQKQKLRRVFKRCYENSSEDSILAGASQVLAESSDTEDN